MNKYILTLALTLQITLSSFATNPFENLTQEINNQALNWSHGAVSELTCDNQLILLNMLAPNYYSAKTQIQCFSLIQSTPELEKSLSELQINISSTVNNYIESICKKPAAQKSMSKNFEAFQQKMEEKISALLQYINTLYYNALYSFMAQNPDNQTKLMYMFDDNGIIPTAQRTRKLPHSIDI